MLDRRLKMQGLAIWKNLRYLIYGVRNTDWTPAWKRLKGNLKLQIANGFLNAVSYRQNGHTNTLQVIYRRKRYIASWSMARNWISRVPIQTKFLRKDFADLSTKSNNYVFVKLFHCFNSLQSFSNLFCGIFSSYLMTTVVFRESFSSNGGRLQA